jgi:hypothetical protein
MAQPICFMVMPFGTKPTGLEPGKGPVEVNFDVLWSKALEPTLRELGYAPVRADQDTGALIIGQMLRRLAHADLVVADVTIANANVYYEIGVRHAAQERGCVLVGADWAKPVFDLAQMRRIGYPLPDGTLDDAAATGVRAVLLEGIGSMRHGTTPVFEAVPGFPQTDGDEASVRAFRDEAAALADWGERLAGIRAMSDRAERTARALALRDELLGQPALADGVALEMLNFLRDATSDWQVTLDWISAMPAHLRDRVDVREQRLLAQAKLKSEELDERIGALQQLIDESGPSSERCGLLGGRFKELYDRLGKVLAEEQDDSRKVKLEMDREDALDDAIAAYASGMQCDLNDYFPSCNLPGLLAIRAREGDADLARTAAGVTSVACQRAKERGGSDPWLNPTLLLAAFQAGDVKLAGDLARQVRRDGPAQWQLESVLQDLRRTVEHSADGAARPRLEAIVEQLERVNAG